MKFDVRSNAREISRWLDDVQKKQIPFATVYAMTLTAKDIAWEEIGAMQQAFDRPTPYTVNALQVTPAKMQTKVASVSFKEDGGKGTPAKRFLNPEVDGGARSQKAHERQIAPLLKGYSYLVPARDVKLDAYGNIPGATYRKILSQLRVSRNADANASASARSKRARKSLSFFVSPKGDMVMERRGKNIKPFLVAVRAPKYEKRFPFYETAETVWNDRFSINFDLAFQRALATSGYKGKWGVAGPAPSF